MDYVEGKVNLSTLAALQSHLQFCHKPLQFAPPPEYGNAFTGCTRPALTQTRQLHLRLQLQTLWEGSLTIEEYITQVSVLKDALPARGERMKESEIILIALGGLGEEFESFVTSITTRDDPNLTFSTLCELLMDQEMKIQKARFLQGVNFNVAAKPNWKSDPQSPATTGGRCQICSRRNHTAVNCYNRLSVTRYPPTNGRELSLHGPSGPPPTNRVSPSANVITTMTGSAMSATSHITNDTANIQQSRIPNGNPKIYTADGSPLSTLETGRSLTQSHSSSNPNFLLDDILFVLASTRNFHSQTVQLRDMESERILLQGKARDGLYQLPLHLE